MTMGSTRRNQLFSEGGKVMRSLGLALLGAGIAAGSASAAPLGTQVTATGTVVGVCSVEALTDPLALPSMNPGATSSVALTYVCNSPGGFTRTITSTNGGKMTRETSPGVAGPGGVGQEVYYTISHQNLVVASLGIPAGTSLGSTSGGTPVVTPVTASAALISGVNSALRVTLPSAANMPALFAGNYRDVITIALTATP